MSNYTISEPILQISHTSARQASRCNLCGDFAQLDDLTLGPFNADNELTFICSMHLKNTRELINLLADFIVIERQRFIESQNFELTSEVPNAWFFY